ncbi:BZ3500_MvSof-1268-A1-R1_Chr12-2g03887 [Microbotryum saponariae]|uniref:BZ3500_MvSof-1268-A1-R1_Chr12-2g03887 protein n=1 Tax=Microbotryum saponariae TaxID=289078 RepID=A0A2X0MJK0_9BASI|nr:BZ3500_MvSof-1268-A1-R1_Chr12-2g03887 [Microbotryum saponariae]SCZ99799.1 BZ3501_MvSof-1269-A2-R1_Chr12-2g03501 [Microbotryum saponariae]
MIDDEKRIPEAAPTANPSDRTPAMQTDGNSKAPSTVVDLDDSEPMTTSEIKHDRSAEKVGVDDDAEGKEAEGNFPHLTTTAQVMLVFFLTLAMVLNVGPSAAWGVEIQFLRRGAKAIQAVVLSLEAIGRDLTIEVVNYQWLTSAYSLAFGAVLLLFGRLADIHGPKLIFQFGMAFFAAFSIGVALAPSQVAMGIFRAMQGVGMGAAIPSALGILGASFAPGQAKSTAFATFSAGAPLGGSLGCVLGGFMTQYASWRTTFYVSAGLGVIVIAGAQYFVPRDPPRNMELTVDWIGAALITIGLTLFTFALADGSGVGWNTPYIPIMFVVGLLTLVAFWFWERHLEFRTEKQPLMLTALWFQGRFACVQLIGALGWCAFSSFMFFATEWFQNLQGLTPLQATVRFLPSPVTGLILNCPGVRSHMIVAVLASRIGAQWLIGIGTLGTGIAPLLYAVQKLHATYWAFQFPAMILCVLGADFIFACSILYVSKVAGPGQQSLAAGLFNLSTQLGTAIGLAIATIVQSKVVDKKVANVIVSTNSTVPPFAVEAGLRAAFWTCAAFSFAGSVVVALCLRGIGKVGTRTKKVKAEEEAAQNMYTILKIHSGDHGIVLLGHAFWPRGQGVWTSIGAGDHRVVCPPGETPSEFEHQLFLGELHKLFDHQRQALL